MRRLAVVLCVMLAACGGRREDACNASATHEVFFSNAEAPDSVTASVTGPACDKAVALYVVRDADGHPLWSWTAPLTRAFGDTLNGAGFDELSAFVERWAAAEISTTSQAPEWARLKPAQTTLDRRTYGDIRARDLPMLCHVSGAHHEVCVFWEPAAGGAGLYYERAAPIQPPPG